MNAILEKKLFLFKEHVGVLKIANHYDVYDPSSKKIILHCREVNINPFTTLLRILFRPYKFIAPFEISIKDLEGNEILKIKKGFSFLLPIVRVYNDKDIIIGHFKRKLSINNSFDIFNEKEKLVCELKGSLLGWNFKFLCNQNEVGLVTKKWAGIGKEMFTSADNYMLEIKDNLKKEEPLRLLILAAVVCIDMVMKE